MPPDLACTDGTLTVEGRERPNVSLLSPAEVKGLEFDHLVLVEPSLLSPDPALRSRVFYICLTRATQTVALVHRRPLPDGLLTAGNSHTQFFEIPSSDDTYPREA